MSKRRIIFTLGILISIAGLWWALSGVQWKAVGESFSSFRLYLISIPFMIVTVASMWFRAARCHYLLRHESPIAVGPLFRITMIGFCYNSILPMRAGEFIRAYLLGRQKNLGLGRGMACLVVERVYDLIMLMLCFLGALMSVKIAPNLEVEVFGFTLKGSHIAPLTRKLIYLTLLLMAGVAFMLFERTRRLVTAAVDRLAFLPHSIRRRLNSAVQSFSSGLRSIHDPRTVAWVVFMSFMVWFTVALSIWILQFGFNGLGRVTMGDSYAIMILIAFAVMLPSGPSYFGMYEAGGIFSLLVLGVTQDRSLALSFTLAMHLLQIIPLVILGLLYAYQDHVSIRKIQEQAQ